eukprot:scaffold21065_cov57-Attheya_sp.AAC.3
MASNKTVIREEKVKDSRHYCASEYVRAAVIVGAARKLIRSAAANYYAMVIISGSCSPLFEHFCGVIFNPSITREECKIL